MNNDDNKQKTASLPIVPPSSIPESDAAPQSAVDAPGSDGKLSASPEYVFSGNAHRAVTRNPEARNVPPIFPAARRLHKPELVPNPGAWPWAGAVIAGRISLDQRPSAGGDNGRARRRSPRGRLTGYVTSERRQPC